MSRQLEIGPGRERLPGFETLNLVPGPHVDHVADCRRLPFPDATFSLIYASHVIEHLPWYETGAVLAEWCRVLRPGGRLELWTVNAIIVARALIALEDGGRNPVELDGWHRFNEARDGYQWVNGRTFAYERKAAGGQANWHRALFTPVSLMRHCRAAGLIGVRVMSRSEVRGKDHGAVNLGVRGEKAC